MWHPEKSPDAQLRSDAELLDAALKAARVAVFALDLQRRRVHWSHGLEDVFGPLTGPAPGVDELTERVHPDDLPRVRAALSRCAEEGGKLDEVHRLLGPEGDVCWVHWQARTESDGQGRPVYLTGICVEATDHQVALLQLRESEARWRTLVDASPLGIDVLDVEGRPVYYNPKCEELHGLRFEQARGAGWADALHPDDRERITASWEAHARSVRPWSETYRFVHPDGQVVWVSGRTAPIYLEGRHVGHVGTLEDITALKTAEQALRRSDAKLRRIIDSGMAGIFYWTADQTITGANQAFLHLLGYRAEEVESGELTVRRITPWRWHAQDDLKVAEARAAGVTSPWEKEFYTADGDTVPVLVVKATWEDTDDRGVAICIDIRPQKLAEREHERLLGREREARHEAQRATRVRDEMMAVLAHDLRNPLNVFGLTVGRMLQRVEASDHAARRDLEMLQRGVANMNALIADLLDVSRVESGRLSVRKAAVPVPVLLREVSEQFDAQARELGIDLSLDAEPELPAVLGEQQRLIQVLANLVGNALKFTDRGGSVLVTARLQAHDVLFSVADTGVGIETRELPHLFDRFWQGTRARRAGSGLGLAIARGVVLAHGGRIWVESKPGRGTVFLFTIPLAESFDTVRR